MDAISFGVNFRQHLTGAVGGCDILLAIIGKEWLTISNYGVRRLDDADDFVRIEIETAMAGASR